MTKKFTILSLDRLDLIQSFRQTKFQCKRSFQVGLKGGVAKGVECLQSVPPFLVQAWAGLKLSILSRILLLKVGLYQKSGVINGKEGKAAALSKFSDTLTLSQPGRADYAHPLEMPCLKNPGITPLCTVGTINKRFNS